MAQKQVTLGSVGPFLYDDASFYAVNTEGQLNVDTAPTVNGHVCRFQDALLVSGNQTVTGVKTFNGEVELNAALNHDGTTVGFYGATPVTQAAAEANLTDNSGGTANDTIAAITNAANAGSADVGPTADAIADLAAKVNAILTALRNLGLIAT